MSKNPHNLQCDMCPSLKKSIFCELSQTDLSSVSKNKVTNSYKKGQTIFHQGNPPYGLYCLSQGLVKVSKIGDDGKESIVRIASPGDVLGHRSLFTEQYYTATATALEDATICFLDKKYIHSSIEKNPTISMNIIHKLSRDLGAAESNVASLHQKNVRERLASTLLLFRQTYGEELEDGRIKLNIKLTREELASIIGVANETLIRFVTEFKDEGILEQEKKVLYITNEEKLLEFANIQY